MKFCGIVNLYVDLHLSVWLKSNTEDQLLLVYSYFYENAGVNFGKLVILKNTTTFYFKHVLIESLMAVRTIDV